MDFPDKVKLQIGVHIWRCTIGLTASVSLTETDLPLMTAFLSGRSQNWKAFISGA